MTSHFHSIIRFLQCINEDSTGVPDQVELERQLQKYLDAPLLLGTFTAGSNVTGIMPDVHSLATLMHQYGGYAVFDYASAASSSTINCNEGIPAEARLDAVMLSPHKFPGGPGTTGALVIRDEMIREFRPQVAGTSPTLQATNRSFFYLTCQGCCCTSHASQLAASLSPSGTRQFHNDGKVPGYQNANCYLLRHTCTLH